MPWLLMLIFVAVLEALPVDVASVKLDDIYWNSSSPMFRIDNTDHIIDVNKGNIPYEYDQVNIICPSYPPGTHEDDAEKYIIYNVSKEEYDTCTITSPRPRIIAICDKPNRVMYITITFRPFTPQPGGLEFRPGQDYYFVSTSSKDNVYSHLGGRCLTHNMRVIFKVCCNPAKTSAPVASLSTTTSTTPRSTILYTRSTTVTTTTTLATTPQHKSVSSFSNSGAGGKGSSIGGSASGSRATEKPKSETKNTDENSTSMKIDELVRSSSGSSRNYQGHTVLLFVCLILLLLSTTTR